MYWIISIRIYFLLGDMLVYEAMADGLATTWKGLGTQLEMRGYILTDTQNLYELAQKHEEVFFFLNLVNNGFLQFSKLFNNRLQQTEYQTEEENAEMQKIIDGRIFFPTIFF